MILCLSFHFFLILFHKKTILTNFDFFFLFLIHGNVTIKFFFLKKIEKKKANQVLSGGWYQREEGGYKERV
jgi:hypothetical protein